jgi:uncharacterized protein (DUF488 family)
MRLFTIGFTKKSAKSFFELLKQSGAKRIIDVRLNNVSQLAGFAKKQDLEYFLEAICGMEYIHLPLLAPTQEMLDAYKKEGGDWDSYERKFLELMAERHIEDNVSREIMENGCLLCSEDTPDQCHRRLVAEYLERAWGGFTIMHLT